jgi:hypothetical protein
MIEVLAKDARKIDISSGVLLMFVWEKDCMIYGTLLVACMSE